MNPRATKPPVRVLIVDSSRIQRAGLALTLGSQPDFEVVGQASDGTRALARVRQEQIDVVLMDIQLPKLDGIAATEKIRTDKRVLAHGPAPRVILLTALDVDAFLPSAAVAGVYAVLFKDIEPESLFATVRDAAGAREPA